MIPKLIRAPYWTKDKPAVTLLNTSSTGFDRDQLQKVASDSKIKYEGWTEIKPEKDHSYLHVITTGAGEYYGSNINGDYYNEDYAKVRFPKPKKGVEKVATLDGGLKKYHKSYKDHGGVYIEHNNSRKGGTSAGDIVAERYNDKMHRGELILKLANDKWGDTLQKIASGDPVFLSQGCFVAGTLVHTDEGYKEVQTLGPGDKVLTHTGKFVAIESSKIKSDMGMQGNVITPYGGLAAKGTDYHQFFVIDCDIEVTPESDVVSLGQWKEAKDIQVGDWVCTPMVYIKGAENVKFPRLCKTKADALMFQMAGATQGKLVYIQETKDGSFLLACVNEDKALFHTSTHLVSKVMSNVSVTLDEFVYDIHIDDADHSYTVNNMAVHNSSLTSDLCSICGNRATNLLEYCDHLRYNKLGITKEGHQVFAYNDAPLFHDISFVKVPADKIAFTLAKVAKATSRIIIDDPGLYVPTQAAHALYYGKDKDRVDLLHKLAKAEKETKKESSEQVKDLKKITKLDKNEEKELERLFDGILPEDILRVLSENNELLPPRAFIKVVLKQDPDKIPGIGALNRILPNIFNHILAVPDIMDDVINDGSYVPIRRCSNRHAVEQAGKAEKLIGLSEGPVSHRIIKVTIKGEPEVVSETISKEAGAITPVIGYIAREYAKYQMSFLEKNGSEKNIKFAVISNQ